MLRRKLLLNLCPLVALLLLTSLLAIWMLEDVLQHLRHIDSQAWTKVEQEALIERFRWLVLGMALVFLIVINFSVLVLLRMSGMIIRPVEHLLAGTRALAEERFDTRIHLEGDDEFGQLAKAYNNMAAQLEASEHRKVEVLGQAALMLNHELNNAINIIELQLQLLTRRAGHDPSQVKLLRQIHEGLQRMTGTVRSLTNIRRIVLTDYLGGIKMLDLKRSTEEESHVEPSGSTVRVDERIAN
jgi:signal transduction histidine kinase